MNISIEELLKNIYDNKTKIELEKQEIDKKLEEINILKQNLHQDNSKLEEQKIDLINNAKIEARNILLKAKEEATSSDKETASKEESALEEEVASQGDESPARDLAASDSENTESKEATSVFNYRITKMYHEYIDELNTRSEKLTLR